MKKIVLLLIVLASCKSIDAVHADWTNPCTDQKDCSECMEWKRKYPSEYKRYALRMEKRNATNYCKSNL